MSRFAPNSTATPTSASTSPLNALTIDVEDYFQVSAFERHVDRGRWTHLESRVVASTMRLLEILEARKTLATFFVLGWIAERFGSLIRTIHQAGHQIGSHSYWHRLVYAQTRGEFRDDLRRSKAVIEDAIGSAISAYRAPSFSITDRSLWAIQVLAEEGFDADSSIFPIRHDRYGIPGARTEFHEIDTPAGAVREYPPAVAQYGRWRVPVGGGGYFRLLPFSVTAHLLRRINTRQCRPFVFYLHPWELDSGQPRLPFGSRLTRFRHYVNLDSTQGKLDELLRRFRFGRLCDLAAF